MVFRVLGEKNKNRNKPLWSDGPMYGSLDITIIILNMVIQLGSYGSKNMAMCKAVTQGLWILRLLSNIISIIGL